MSDRRTAKRKRTPPPESSNVRIVAIGASAGGLDALRRLFKAMPGRTGVAFVLIQHFDPDHKSHMAELLSRDTPMKVREATDRAVIEGDCVYVIPPNRSMTCHRGKLHLTLPKQRRGLRTPIDRFLISLAEDQGEKSVCILLSSAGSDGILGLRAVKAAGGMSMVQDPATAQYGEMPRGAIATGLVDHVLPVEQMPRTLLGYLNHSYVRGPDGPASENAHSTLARILDFLRHGTRQDFRLYKRGTLIRRIERRMGLRQIRSMKGYLAYLKKKPDEAIQLTKDLLIGVTSFFRDPPAFEELKVHAVPALFRGREPESPIRVWVPGCATGEEAYSIGMVILEEMAERKWSGGLQIFATDIDGDSLQFGRASRYPHGIAENVSPARLKRFFTPVKDGYVVNKHLRECVIFAAQNLISSPPFSKIDLISCRNLAIYLETEAQKKLVEVFHFALTPRGFLMLGPSEGINGRDDLFQPVSKKWRLFRKVAGGRRELIGIPAVQFQPASSHAIRSARSIPSTELADLNRRLVTEHQASGGALTDRKGRVLHLTGPIQKYLELAGGEQTLDLPSLVREGFRSRLRAAMQTALREERKVTLEREDLRRDDAYHPVRVTIAPVKSPPSAEGLLHVVFEEASPDPPGPAPAGSVPGEAREVTLRQLEGELQSTRQDLQNSIEELETSNEELKVANEEVLSSNEELQSTNEELETSKEELQSLNEELETVNSQLQEKVQDLTDSTNDLANLLSSTDIATVFLDTKFRIKRFTPPVAKLLNLIPTDVGRPMRHLAQNLIGVDFLEDAQIVLRKLVPVQRQVRSRDGAWYVMRVLPYRTTDNVIEGVVITFADVSELAGREELLREREERLRIVAEVGARALARMPLDRLMNLATHHVRKVLRADLSDILEKQNSGSSFRFRAGSGWKNLRPGREIPTTARTAPRRVLGNGSLAFMDALASPERPVPTRVQRAEGVVSCVYSVIPTDHGAVGVIGAHSRRKLAFTHEDGVFLRDLAGILGSAVSRERTDAEQRAVSRFLEDRVRERTQWLAVSREVARAANRAESAVEVMNRALSALCSGSAWRFGHVFLSHQTGHPPALQAYWYPQGTERFLPFLHVVKQNGAGSVRKLPSLVLRKKVSVWVLESGRTANGTLRNPPHFGGDSSMLPEPISQLGPVRARLARRLRIRTIAAVPIKVSENTLGAIEVCSDQALRPSRPLLDMMEQVAAEVARSLERVDAQERIAAALWREQKSIAQELHDTIGQELTGLGAMSESLMVTLNRKGLVDAARVKRLTRGLRETLVKLRSVTHGLLPMEIGPRDLRSALGKLAVLTEARFGLRCTLNSPRPVAVPSREIATHLYRIAQESITNAVRHARARRIAIGLRKAGRELILTIRDDGRGIRKDPQQQYGAGLRILGHRANAIGARLTVRSSKGQGTTITCMVPLIWNREGDAFPQPPPISLTLDGSRLRSR